MNMALSYSFSEWFVPQFQTLTGPNQPTESTCVWHNAKRTPKRDGGRLIRCGNPIGKTDAKQITQLLVDLRKSADGGKQCLQILRDLSSLLLCRSRHRSSNAETVFNSWIAEIGMLEPAPVTPKQARRFSTPESPSHHQTTSTKILQALEITIGSPTTCRGKNENGVKCKNFIDNGNEERLIVVATALAADWTLSDRALTQLEELARFALCSQQHQDQAPLKPKEWTAILKSIGPPRLETINIDPQTPLRQTSQYFDNDTPQTRVSSLWTSPKGFRSSQSTATTPSSSPSVSRTTYHSPIARQPTFDRTYERACVSPTPLSRQTRSATNRQTKSTTPISHTQAFEPLRTAKSPSEVAQYVMEKIKQKISVNEEDSGFVYGFRRSGCDLIKIGTTKKTVDERMRAICTACHYTPRVVFRIATKHAMKVERLVHRQLYSQKRQECLVNGLCNNGKGCPAQHNEWFEGLSDTYAEAVVRAWVSWINQEPYDAKNCLKTAWVARVAQIKKSQGDFWMRWTSTTLVEETKKEAHDEALDAAIKTEKVLRVLSGLSPPRLDLSAASAGIKSDLSLPNTPISVPVCA